MKHRNVVKRLLDIGLIGMLTAVSSHVLASGFQLFEYNGIAAGDAGAGGAAIAEDASTGFINPAGLTRLKHPQLAIAGNFVMAKSTFEGSSRWFMKGAPATSIQFSGSANGSNTALVPVFHYAAPLTQNLVFGFGVTAPFGLSTHYSESDFTRYATTTSEITAIDISPSLGFKVNDRFSAGFGVDIEKLTATLNSMGGLPGGLPGGEPLGATRDSLSNNEASDWGYGWHTGLLYQLTPATRLGLSYRSQVVFHPAGTSTLTGPLANAYPYISPAKSSSMVQTDVTLPPMTTLSLYHQVNERLALMGSTYYTQWNTIKAINLHNVISAKSPLNPTGLIDVSLPQHYRNTWRFSVGANYQLMPELLLRAGVGYDQTPTIDSERSLRLPDANRTLVSIGTHYQATRMVGLDLGYTHIFFKDARINYTATAGSAATENIGVSKNAADLIGAQITWNLG